MYSTPNIGYKDPDTTEEENSRLPAHTDCIHLEERITYAASGHRNPRLEFSRKGAIRGKNEMKMKKNYLYLEVNKNFMIHIHTLVAYKNKQGNRIQTENKTEN